MSGWLKYRLQHGRQATHASKFTPCSAAALDCDHQRDRFGFSRLIQIGRLFDAIVFDHEILRLQSVNHIAVCVSHQSGHQHDVAIVR